MSTTPLEKQTPSDILWEAKYAPKTIDDLVLPKSIKSQIEDGNIRNFLFSGQPGTGKTSTGKVISRNRTLKFIDCSADRGIGTIRDEISSFCEIASVDGVGLKVILLDEVDALPHLSQQALRGTIEKYQKVARFIATCNYPEKLLTPILSRFTTVNFDLPNKEDQNEQIGNYARRIMHICSLEGMSVDQAAIAAIIKKFYPDMRTVLQVLQDCYERGTKIITADTILKSSAAVQDDAFEKIINESSSVELYKFFSGWKTKENVLISALQQNFAQYIWNRYKDQHGDKLGQVAVLCHKYGVESKQSIDLFVTMLAMVSELAKTLK